MNTITKLSFDDFEKIYEDKIYWNEKKLFVESRGVNPHIHEIVDFIFEYMEKNEPFEEIKKGQDTIKNYKIYIGKYFNDTIFINTIFIQYYLPYDKNSFPYDGKLILKNGFYCEHGQVGNAMIKLIHQGAIKPTKAVLAHELGHLYRYAQLITKNHDKKNEGEIKRLNKYRDNIQALHTSTDNLERNVRETIYQINKDEIHSKLEELYSMIINNKRINRENYKEYIKNEPIFLFKEKLKETCQNIDSYPLEIKKRIGEIYSKDVTPIKGFKLFRNKILFYYQYITNKMYNTISYALDKAEQIDENRKISYTIGYKFDYGEFF